MDEVPEMRWAPGGGPRRPQIPHAHALQDARLSSDDGVTGKAKWTPAMTKRGRTSAHIKRGVRGQRQGGDQDRPTGASPVTSRRGRCQNEYSESERKGGACLPTRRASRGPASTATLLESACGRGSPRPTPSRPTSAGSAETWPIDHGITSSGIRRRTRRSKKTWAAVIWLAGARSKSRVTPTFCSRSRTDKVTPIDKARRFSAA